MGIKHAFTSAKADGSDGTLVQPSNWNADHTITAEVNVPVVASPATPATGANFFARTRGNRTTPAWIAQSGIQHSAQPALAHLKVMEWCPNAQLTTVTTIGCTATTAIGTPTARTPASTNLFTSATRVGYVSSAVATNAGGTADNNCHAFWRGNAAGLGGFFLTIRFGISDASFVATGQTFVGLLGTGSAITAAPSTLVNCLGVGNDNGDAVLQLYASGSVAQPRTSLGANFPCNTISTDLYELILYAAPNDTQVGYQVTRLNTGDTTSGSITVAANLPATTQFMTPNCQRNNGGTAAAVAIDMFGMYAELEV